MPAPPVWAPRINEIAYELEHLPKELIGSNALQSLLGIGPRAAQEILAPIVTEHRGRAGFAPRDAVIARLRELAGPDADPEFERDRRLRLAAWIAEQERQIREVPRLLIEAPDSIVNTIFSQLEADGVTLEPGFITVSFESPEQALQKLLGLAKAAARDLAGFEERVEVRI